MGFKHNKSCYKSIVKCKQFIIYISILIFTISSLCNILNLSFPNFKSDDVITTNTKTTKNDDFSEIDRFGSSLFCNISHKRDKNKYKKLLKDIYNIQFNHSCDINGKYYIISMDDLRTNRGFFSFIDHEYTPPFALSLFTNRTFVFTQNSDRKPWVYLKKNGKTIPKLCQNRTGKNCIFKKVSNCTKLQINKIIDYAKETNNYTVIDYTHKPPNICKKSKRLTPEQFHQITKDYMVIYQRFECNLFWSRKEVMNRGLIETMIQQRNWNINYHEFNSIIWSLLIRPQNNVKNMINDIVQQTLKKYKWQSKENTISIPIRGSDKCKNDKNNNETLQYLNKPEMFCFHPLQFLNVAEIIQKQQKHKGHAINSIIVTSEDKNIMDFIHQNERKYPSFKFIYNDQDIMPNCGLVQDLDKKQRNNEQETFKLLISMLSTIKLQMHANYYIIQRQSNFGHAIWGLSNNVHCQIDQYIGTDDNADNHKFCLNLQNQRYNETIFWDERCSRRDRFDAE